MTDRADGRGVGMPLESDGRYQEIFENAPVARLISDESGVIQELNRSAEELLAASRSLVVGQPLEAFVPPDDRGEFQERVLDAAGTGTPTSWLGRVTPQAGPTFHAQIHLAGSETDAGHLHWALTDVTDRMAMEEKLRLLASGLEERVREATREVEAERARLAAVVDQIPAGLTIVGVDGEVVLANAEARRLLEDDAMEPIPGIPVGEEGRAEVARSDGTSLVLSVSVAPVVDAEGRRIGSVNLFRDISERERQERAEREFVTNAAHQLQSPLAGILSAIDVLQAGAKDGPEREVFLGHIERESHRLARLARALLILARAQIGYEAPRDELVALEPLLNDVAGSLRLTREVVTEVVCPSDLAAITNRELLEQALVNVAENAAKYTLEGRIGLEAEPEGEAVRIVVSDTGPGIPAGDQIRVFDRFFRVAKNGSDGFGLGFAIVRAAVYAVGGEVELESATGVGTKVTMRLPRAASLVQQ